jgi:hypothetical protein
VTKRAIPKSGLHIGKLTFRGRTLRDFFNVPGPVVIDEVTIEGDIGGDAVNATEDESEPEPPGDVISISGATARTIKHVAIGALSIGGMVAASGIATALGWG